MEEFDRKFAAARSELAAADFWPTNAYPPIQTLLSKFGLKTRPPHYAPFIVAFNAAAILFAVIWGGTMWLLIWSNDGMAPIRALNTAILSGAFFGLAMALYYAYGRKKYDLTPWHKL